MDAFRSGGKASILFVVFLGGLGRSLPLQGAVQDEDGEQHQHQGDGQGDIRLGDEAGDEIAHKAHRRHGDGVGQLGGDVVHVVTLSAGGGHDGGVGDG